MAARREHQSQHSQYTDDPFNANQNLSGAGIAALDPGTGIDDYLETDLNLDSGDPNSSSFAPRTFLSSYQDPGLPSYTESELAASSSTHANYEVTSALHSTGPQHLANQSPYPAYSVARGSAPWNPVSAALPFHTRLGESDPDPQTPARPGKLSSIPLDSGYRSSSQYDAQSHLSTPATASMDPSYFMPQPFEQAPLESPFPDYDETQQHQMNPSLDQDDDSQYEINTSQHQETVQEEQTVDFQRQGLLCRHCGVVAKTQSDWKKHVARHTRPNVCCEKSCPRSKVGNGFATSNDRDRHEKSVHQIVTQDGGKSFKCAAPGGCKSKEKDKIWPRLDNFKSHVIRMHPNEDLDEVVRLSQRDDFPNQVRNEDQQVISREVHRQEDEVRQQQAARRSSMISIVSNESGRNKRPAQDDLAAPRSTPRQRLHPPNMATLNTNVQYHNGTPHQDSRFLSPNAGGSMTHIFGRGYTQPRQNSQRPNTPHHQSDTQLMTAPGMTRSISHQENQFQPRRNTYANPQQFNLYQQNFEMPNFAYGANQSGQPIPEEAQSAYDPRAFNQTWGPPPQFTPHQYLNMHERHTVAGNLDYHAQPDFGFQQAEPPVVNMAHHSEILLNVGPDLQHLSVSPTATGNDPVTPLPLPQSPHSPAPAANGILDDVAPSSDSDHMDEEVTQFLDSFEEFKHVITSGSRGAVKRFLQKVKGSSKAGSSSRTEIKSDDASSYAHTTSSTRTVRPQAQPQHRRQGSKASCSTSAARSIVSTGTAAHKAESPWTPTTQSQSFDIKGKGKAQSSKESSPADDLSTSSPPAPDHASASAPKGTATATLTALSREQAGKTNSTCPLCSKAIGRGSDLKKHMKRHSKPYHCIWDGCQKVFGSKNDWKRHETIRHPEQIAGWRCDGQHADFEAGNGVGCAKWWPVEDAKSEGAFDEVRTQYMQHLVAAGVGQRSAGLEEVHEVLMRCFIPHRNRGAFWCGFCDRVVPMVAPSNTPADDPDSDKHWLKERLDHIESHFLPEATRLGSDVWRELGGKGLMKKEMEWFVVGGGGITAGGDDGDEGGSS